MWRNWQTRRFQVPVGNRMGSNPFIRTKQENAPFTGAFFLFSMINEFMKGFEGGSRFAEANALPYATCIKLDLTAKDDVNNVGAGRAAKGENPFIRTKKYCRKGYIFCSIFLSIAKAMAYHHALACMSSP